MKSTLAVTGVARTTRPPRRDGYSFPRRAPAAGTGFLWPVGRSSRVRPRGAPSRRPARPGVPGTTRYRVSRRSRRSRRTSGTRVPRPPLALPTRSNNHGPRRSPDRGRDIHARRAASQAAPVAPLPSRASASWLARAAGIEARLTAHSGRVGLASELTARGASTTEVMLAGNWKTARMVAHYSAGATAERGAVARYL